MILIDSYVFYGMASGERHRPAVKHANALMKRFLEQCELKQWCGRKKSIYSNVSPVSSADMIDFSQRKGNFRTVRQTSSPELKHATVKNRFLRRDSINWVAEHSSSAGSQALKSRMLRNGLLAWKTSSKRLSRETLFCFI